MKCKFCSKTMEKNSYICPRCGNDNSEIIRKNFSTYKKILLIAGVIFFVCICMIIIFNNNMTNFENITYKNFQRGNLSYEAPENWTYSTTGGFFHYDSLSNYLFVKNEPCELYTDNKSHCEEIIKKIISTNNIEDYVEVERDFFNKDFSYKKDVYVMHLTFTGKMQGDDIYSNLYAFNCNDMLYEFMFVTKNSDKQSEEFDVTESKIINSIKVKGSTAETTAEKPTEKETEATTEKPTEKPTEKATEKPTEKTTEKETEPTIFNNTSTGGWWANGTGDYVASGLTVTGYGVLHVEYYGDGYFSVKSYENDKYDDLLVANVGNYSGDVLIDHTGTFEIAIKSEGDWSITSSGLSIEDTTSFSGSGDAVTGVTSHDGGNWKITYDGDDYFSVKQYGINEGYMDLLVAETDGYSGVVKSEKGDNIFFVVSATGNWSINKQ